jgi:hypothetical protein
VSDKQASLLCQFISDKIEETSVRFSPGFSSLNAAQPSSVTGSAEVGAPNTSAPEDKVKKPFFSSSPTA